jgi:hypothetical protein
MFAIKEATKREVIADVDRASRLPTTGRNHASFNAPNPMRLKQRYVGNNHLQSSAETIVQRKEGNGNSDGIWPGFGQRNRLLEQEQTKLQVGPADDVYEREADRVSDQVIRMPDSEGLDDMVDSRLPIFHRLLTGPSQRHHLTANFQFSRGAGHPLSPATCQFMEPRFGADFNHVRLHTGGQAHQMAAQIQAKAFTYNNHIWLGKGESELDKALMAHELTHVMQQGANISGTIPQQIQRTTVIGSDNQ